MNEQITVPPGDDEPYGARFLAHYLSNGGSLEWSYAKVQKIKDADRHQLSQLLNKWLSNKEKSGLLTDSPEGLARLVLARQAGMTPGDKAVSAVLSLLFGWLPYDLRRTVGLTLWFLVWSALVVWALAHHEFAAAFGTAAALLAPIFLSYWDRMFPDEHAENAHDGRYGISVTTSLKLSAYLAGIVGLGLFMWMAFAEDEVSLLRILLGIPLSVVCALFCFGISMLVLYAKYRMALFRESQDTLLGLLFNLMVFPLLGCLVVAVIAGIHPFWLAVAAVMGLVTGATSRGWYLHQPQPNGSVGATDTVKSDTEENHPRLTSVVLILTYVLIGIALGHAAYYLRLHNM